MDFEMKEALSDKAADLVARSKRFKAATVSSLCGMCSRAHIYKLRHKNDPIIHCSETKRDMPHNVEECNRYQQEGTLGIWQLAKLAKIIDVDPERKVGIYHEGKGE